MFLLIHNVFKHKNSSYIIIIIIIIIIITIFIIKETNANNKYSVH